MTGEGSLGAPTRENIKWQEPDFADPAKLDAEMRRVFDICHGCRRCFNLCDSFPRLFDLIDNSPKEDVEHLASEDFKPVVEACTLCDMCFMTKCPYVPPHPFMLDFPHLMLRHRFVETKQGKTEFVQRQIGHVPADLRVGEQAGVVTLGVVEDIRMGGVPAVLGQTPEDMRLEEDFRALVREKPAARAFDVADELVVGTL